MTMTDQENRFASNLNARQRAFFTSLTPAERARLIKASGSDRAFIQLIGETMLDHVALLRERVITMQAQIDAWRQKALTSYEGTWEPGAAYGEGVTVTQGGSLWRSNKHGATDRPGRSDQWTLIVKRGRDGRNAPRAA